MALFYTCVHSNRQRRRSKRRRKCMQDRPGPFRHPFFTACLMGLAPFWPLVTTNPFVQARTSAALRIFFTDFGRCGGVSDFVDGERTWQNRSKSCEMRWWVQAAREAVNSSRTNILHGPVCPRDHLPRGIEGRAWWRERTGLLAGRQAPSVFLALGSPPTRHAGSIGSPAMSR